MLDTIKNRGSGSAEGRRRNLTAKSPGITPGPLSFLQVAELASVPVVRFGAARPVCGREFQRRIAEPRNAASAYQRGWFASTAPTWQVRAVCESDLHFEQVSGFRSFFSTPSV
jgi:hypothetical protein